MDRTRDATSGGVRLKRELTINRSLSQGQKESLPIFFNIRNNHYDWLSFYIPRSTNV